MWNKISDVIRGQIGRVWWKLSFSLSVLGSPWAKQWQGGNRGKHDMIWVMILQNYAGFWLENGFPDRGVVAVQWWDQRGHCLDQRQQWLGLGWRSWWWRKLEMQDMLWRKDRTWEFYVRESWESGRCEGWIPSCRPKQLGGWGCQWGRWENRRRSRPGEKILSSSLCMLTFKKSLGTVPGTEHTIGSSFHQSVISKS